MIATVEDGGKSHILTIELTVFTKKLASALASLQASTCGGGTVSLRGFLSCRMSSWADDTGISLPDLSPVQ